MAKEFINNDSHCGVAIIVLDLSLDVARRNARVVRTAFPRCAHAAQMKYSSWKVRAATHI